MGRRQTLQFSSYYEPVRTSDTQRIARPPTCPAGQSGKNSGGPADYVHKPGHQLKYPEQVVNSS